MWYRYPSAGSEYRIYGLSVPERVRSIDDGRGGKRFGTFAEREKESIFFPLCPPGNMAWDAIFISSPLSPPLCIPLLLHMPRLIRLIANSFIFNPSVSYVIYSISLVLSRLGELSKQTAIQLISIFSWLHLLIIRHLCINLCSLKKIDILHYNQSILPSASFHSLLLLRMGYRNRRKDGTSLEPSHSNTMTLHRDFLFFTSSV